MLTAEQILKKVKRPDVTDWDQKTVQDALAVKEELVPKLLEQLNGYLEQLQDPTWEPEDADINPNYNSYTLLVEMKETKLYPVLLKYLAQPERVLDSFFGFDLTEGLKDYLAAVYDGSLEETEALVLNTQAYEFARSTTLQAMGRLCRAGVISREELIRFLREVIKAHVTPENISEIEEKRQLPFPVDDTILSGVQQTAELVHLHEICLDMRDLVQCGALFDAAYSDYLDNVFNWPDASREEWNPPELRGDAEEETETGTDAGGPTAKEREILSYRCGRNDPCPCGSGKKFKKCHLREQEDLQAKYGNQTAKPKPKFNFLDQFGELEPIIYPPVENVGDEPGLAAYFPREAIEVDIHVYRGMKIVNDRPMNYEIPLYQIRLATEELWTGFKGFEKICQEKGCHTYEEYDRTCQVHYSANRWLKILAFHLREARDIRAAAVEKWLKPADRMS